MTYYIQAYDDKNQQILGNLDGQAMIEAKDLTRTQRYKELPWVKTLNGRVYYYLIEQLDKGKYLEGTIIEKVYSETYQPQHT